MRRPFDMLLPILAAILVSAGGPAVAAVGGVPTDTLLSKPLKCWIEHTKILVAVNSSGGTIAAGTRISYTFRRMPDYAVQSGSVVVGTLAPGTLVKRGVGPAFDCKASFRKPQVLSPSP